MCLTIPKKVIEIKDDLIIVEMPNGDRQTVKSIVELEVGDYCFSQQGIVIQKIDKEDAEEILNMIRKG
jgi:hydrogenase maturation factor